MPRGYDRALYILPFDHRGSFQAKMFGWKSPLSEEQSAETSRAKVRCNPRGDLALNTRQATRLTRLSEFLAAQNRNRFMFELLVPGEKTQLEKLNGYKATYDRELRPRLMVEAIQELQDAGVEPDLWKVEGLDRREDCERLVAAARAGGRDHVRCIILGRGEDERKVRQWLGMAAEVPGFIGFAVGRTVFWDPLVAWRSKKATREQTVAAIARRYREFVDLFERANTRLPSELSDRTGSRHYS